MDDFREQEIQTWKGEIKKIKDFTDEELAQMRFVWLGDEEAEIVLEEIDYRDNLK